MLLILAWRNIWRNKKRSLIIVAAIAAGLLSGLFASAVMFGMVESLINSTIDRDLGHVQIHSTKYEDEKLLADTISNYQSALRIIKNQEHIKGVSSRVVLEGIGSSATTSTGLRIVGINPDEEKSVTIIYKRIIAGSYFKEEKRNQILIGKKLADDLGIKEKSKIVLSFQDFDGNIIYGAFRVSGIFETESSVFDKMNVFLEENDLFSLLNVKPVYHEIAIRLNSVQNVDSVYANLSTELSDLSVKNWKELAPELKLMNEMIGLELNIFVGVILFALLFGITNTMLMSVMERVREFGVLMAIGMKRRRVFTMIILETILLSLVGGVIGMILASSLITWIGKVGINLSAFTEGFTAFSISPMLHPILPIDFYASITIMIIITAIFSAIYPAVKAIKLKPSQAIRTY